MSQDLCQPCVDFRAGIRENVEVYGFTVHACERKREGDWSFDACPCGCAKREPGQLAKDRAIHGAAYLTPLGARIDPESITFA